MHGIETKEIKITPIYEGDRLFNPVIYWDNFGDLAGLDFSIEPQGKIGVDSWSGRENFA